VGTFIYIKAEEHQEENSGSTEGLMEANTHKESIKLRTSG